MSRADRADHRAPTAGRIPQRRCTAAGVRRAPAIALLRHARRTRERAVRLTVAGALNKFGFAEVLSVSCGSAGSCAAGGYYTDGHRYEQGFVAVERDGVWGRAIEVPGLGALNKGGEAEVTSVSCASAGNCAAGGEYFDRRTGRRDHMQGCCSPYCRAWQQGPCRCLSIPQPGVNVSRTSCARRHERQSASGHRDPELAVNGSTTAVLTAGKALDGVELCEVVDVLRAMIIAGAELALLLSRQAIHATPSD
jgi:hypothetical protein